MKNNEKIQVLGSLFVLVGGFIMFFSVVCNLDFGVAISGMIVSVVSFIIMLLADEIATTIEQRRYNKKAKKWTK